MLHKWKLLHELLCTLCKRTTTESVICLSFLFIYCLCFFTGLEQPFPSLFCLLSAVCQVRDIKYSSVYVSLYYPSALFCELLPTQAGATCNSHMWSTMKGVMEDKIYRLLAVYTFCYDIASYTAAQKSISRHFWHLWFKTQKNGFSAFCKIMKIYKNDNHYNFQN